MEPKVVCYNQQLKLLQALNFKNNNTKAQCSAIKQSKTKKYTLKGQEQTHLIFLNVETHKQGFY